jgi:hypothetical protein
MPIARDLPPRVREIGAPMSSVSSAAKTAFTSV